MSYDSGRSKNYSDNTDRDKKQKYGDGSNDSSKPNRVLSPGIEGSGHTFNFPNARFNVYYNQDSPRTNAENSENRGKEESADSSRFEASRRDHGSVTGEVHQSSRQNQESGSFVIPESTFVIPKSIDLTQSTSRYNDLRQSVSGRLTHELIQRTLDNMKSRDA